MSDTDTALVDSLKVLDPERPIREATELLRRCEMTRGAKRRPEQVQQTEQAYSITSSAIARRPGGKVRPNGLAVLRLITNSNLVDRKTGRSAGFSPLRIRPV